jgi:lysophospholipase L1-like esterase
LKYPKSNNQVETVMRKMTLKQIVFGLWMAVATAASAAPATLTLTGDWQVKVEAEGITAALTVDRPEQVMVVDEKIGKLPLFNAQAAAYARGAKLAGVRAMECSVRHALDPDSLVVRTAVGGAVLERGRDYEAELSWGCVGRLEGGAIGPETPVVASYTYGTMRLDAVVLTADRKIVLRKGIPHVANPAAPPVAAGERRLANIWLTARLPKLDDAHLFPVLETAYPQPPQTSPTAAERLIPNTMAKLKAGGTLRILAWGDSVTDGAYLRPDRDQNRWQEQFVRRLRARYPEARIVLTTEAWGGRNTDSFRNEPPGSIHNYKEKVLDARPDLIISEFVNDAGFDEEAVFQRYGRIRDEFKSISAEWIILTPHYVRPDWMGLASEKEIDPDPRPYVKALRKFAAENNIALADASLRYGRLWRQGIPYSTLLMNNINHPNPYGMGLFADALMALFP